MATKARQKAQAKYNSKPEQVKRRMARNRARAKMIREGKASVGDGKDVAHKNGNPHDNKSGNLEMQSKAENRSFKRTKKGRKKNPKD